jgi:tRNA-splicing ligase RtcB
MHIIGDHEQKTLEQLADVAGRAWHAAIMADGHLGYIMPIGGVAAYPNKVSVAGVGFDIACGNCAILTDLYEDDLSHLDEIADAIQSEIVFGVGGINKDRDKPDDHPLFDAPEWEAVPEFWRGPKGKPCGREWLRRLARNQIGTVGSGNHYVDIFVDTYSRVWVGVHFGSRGLGHKIASGFMALDRGDDFGARGPEHEALLSLDTPLGDAYWAMMNLAGVYAYLGREWVTRKVVRLLGGEEQHMVHNHHNFAWKEEHYGRDRIVVRKGATPAFPGQEGFVGGSMGDISVILQGGNDAAWRNQQELALFSTVHGAGRVMGRMEAKGKIHRKTGRVIREGKVSQEMMDAWIQEKGVVLRGGGLDESPHVYRRLPDVLKAQGGTVEINETLYPLVVVMAE